jgi:hypothetical protein
MVVSRELWRERYKWKGNTSQQDTDGLISVSMKNTARYAG